MKRWFTEIEKLLKKGVSEESRFFAGKYASKAGKFIDRTMKGIDQEASETREMASSFFRLLEHKLRLNERTDPPSKEEVRAAIEQLKDVGRYSVFITAVVLPGGVVSLVGLELLASKYGINFSFIPSAFKKKQPGNAERIENLPLDDAPPKEELSEGGSSREETPREPLNEDRSPEAGNSESDTEL